MTPDELVDARSDLLVDTLGDLRAEVAAARLELAAPGAEPARTARDTLIAQVDDYLLPRLRELDAPLLAVVGGSTGAGKSTLVNTLVGDGVTRAGWLRPTTRGPVLVCHPEDLHWFEGDRVLPDLPRTTGAAAGGELRLVAHANLPRGLAMLDAPDIDSVVAENRALANQLLAAADLWIFVTTAARYADAVPWDLLHTAQERSTALAVVLNRVPPDGVEEIGAHLAAMLAENGLARATLFAIPEMPMEAEDLPLPGDVVAPLAGWLTELAGDEQARADVVRTTLDGALQSIRRRVLLLAREVDEQLVTAATLRADADDAYAAAGREIDDGVRSGSVLRGEVLARWQEFVGTGEFTRNLELRIGRLRDRVTAFLTGRPAPAAAVEEALESSLEVLVRSSSDAAAERTSEVWRGRPAGRALLAGHATRTDRTGELAASSAEFRPALQSALRAWQADVLALVSQEGAGKRTQARLASFGANGAGIVLMLAVFAHTGGLSGLEVLIAGGSSVVNQKLLEAVFGDSAVRALAAKARADLTERVEELLAAERSRFDELVDAAAPPDGSGAALRERVEDFEKSRRAWRPASTAPLS